MSIREIEPHPNFVKGLEIGAISAKGDLSGLGSTALQTSQEWLDITESFMPGEPSDPSHEEYIEYQALRDGILRSSFEVFYRENRLPIN